MGSRESTATRSQESKDSGVASFPPETNKSSREKTIPSGFRMSGGAKELHGQKIYCVAWSTDLYESSTIATANDVDQSADKGDGQGNGDSSHASDCEAPVSLNKPTEQAKDATTSHGERGHSPLLRCLASCGGNQVTVYEVDAPDSASSSGRGGLTLRQAYVDEDENEIFYTCAFGGRCLGRPFGYGPTRESNGNEDTNRTVLSSSDTGLSSAAGNSFANLLKKRPRSEISNDSSRPVDHEPNGVPRRQLFQQMTDLKSFDGPQLLCVAGGRGVIKVIDTVRRMLFMTLSGHGDEINDMKFSPTNEWLLLSASKDESLRLWNVKTATCVAIFAGHEGHRDSVLSLGWHPLGERFVSAGMDTTVKLWSIEEGTEVSKAIQLSNNPQPQAKKQPPEDSSKSDERSLPIYEQMPYFSSNKVHTDYIDCVQFVGDLVLSKSTTNTVVLWMPDLSTKSSHRGSKYAHQRLPNELVALREFPLSKCEVWFIRFQTDFDCRMLAIGNTIGEVRLWEIGSSPTKKHFANLTHQNCCSTVRNVSFSPDGKCLVASCDDATLWKWDAV